MNAATVLTRARRILAEKNWVQGAYQEVGGLSLHLTGKGAEKGVIFDDISGRQAELPVAKVDAVCAVGALELAFADKGLNFDEVMADELLKDVTGGGSGIKLFRSAYDFLVRAIEEHMTSTASSDDSLLKEYKEYIESCGHTPESYPFEWFVEDTAEDGGGAPDGVEDWNDRIAKSKDEVLDVFDRAIEFAGGPPARRGNPTSVSEVLAASA